jgi:HPt (histidine-containing phosphotransfer) domain-containing protein
MTEHDVIDRPTFDRLLVSLGGDVEFLEELLETFFDDAPVQLAAMQAALVEGNAESLRRAAHSMKSNSASFGALALSKQCKELEDLARAGALDRAPGRVANIEAAYQMAKSALEVLTAGL